MKLDLSDLGRVASFFRAFSEPTRLALLQELKDGERSVGELVEALHVTQANISRQLRVLHEAGLLSREKRGTGVFYEICEPIVLELCKLACEKLNREPKKRKLGF
ncbi:winged helix-turn-helix transcriptional regulator [Akkermansiaceae bacterium]|nr:winged helix-turn-helix transcriptional regulator [Akkermansiaceae bacterium]